MLQKHPIVKTEQLLILKVESKSLSGPESFRKVTESINKLKPSFVIVSAPKKDTETLQQIADLFFNEHPEDAWHLFESFRARCIQLARKLGFFHLIKDFFDNMKETIQDQADVNTFSSDERHREEFTNFLLSFGEMFALDLVSACLTEEGLAESDHPMDFLTIDARKLIVFGKDRNKKPVLSHSESVDNISKILKTNSGKTIIMSGSLAKDNKRLGEGGIEITIGLVSSAYQQNGIEPVLVRKEKVLVEEKVFA